MNGLLFSLGERLTVIGSNLDAVQRPQMNTSVIFSRDGNVTNHKYNITVRRRTIYDTVKLVLSSLASIASSLYCKITVVVQNLIFIVITEISIRSALCHVYQSAYHHHQLSSCGFYRVMHFSAKRGIAIACRLSVRLSVRPSVTLVNCDDIGWNSSKIISPLVSVRRSLFETPTWRVCSKGNTPKFRPKVTHSPVDLSVGDILSQIAAEWLQIAQRSQWRAYRKLPSLFLMVLSLTPYDLSFPPKRGFHMPPTYANGHISATGDPIHFMFGSRLGFSGTADRMALFPVQTNPRWQSPPCWKNLKWRYLRNRSSDPLHVWF